ncbi:hypothetical protein ES707_04262 [subsurface metagenome]
MIDLILQRERVGAVRADRQREDQPVAVAVVSRAGLTVLDITVERRAVRYDQDRLALGIQVGIDGRVLRRQLERRRIRTVGAEIDQSGERAGRNDRTGTGRLPGAVVVRIAGRQLVLVDLAGNRAGNDGRAIIFKADLAGNVGRVGHGVAIAIGRGDGGKDLAAADRDIFVDVAAEIGTAMFQRDVLNDRDLAGHRIDRDRKGCRVCAVIGRGMIVVWAVIAADDQVAFLEQEDARAVGGIDAGIGAVAAERQREHLRVRRRRTIRAEIDRDRECRAGALRKADRPIDLLRVRNIGIRSLVVNIGEEVTHRLRSGVVIGRLNAGRFVVNDGESARDVSVDIRTVIEEGDELADVDGVGRRIAVGILHRQRRDDLAFERLLDRQRIVRRRIVAVAAVIVGFVVVAAVVMLDRQVLGDADFTVGFDRDRERHLAVERTAGHGADHEAIGVDRQVDRAAVRREQAGGDRSVVDAAGDAEAEHMRVRRRVRADDGIVEHDRKIAVRIGDRAIAGDVGAIAVAGHVGVIPDDAGILEVLEQRPDAARRGVVGLVAG